MAAIIIAVLIGAAVGYVIAPKGGGGATNTNPTQTTSTTSSTQTSTNYSQQGGTQGGTSGEEYTIKLAYSDKVGFYLTDSQGRTLYVFAKDINGSSACYGTCAEKWPPFYTETIKVSPGLDPNDFGVITRSDGKKQITYKGWPLYYFFKDNAPGDINGDGVKNVWYVAKPDYTVLVGYKEGLGLFLVDSKGMTLYFFANDANETSSCYGQCAEKWPVFAPSPSNEIVIPSILNITDFNVIVRDDGKIQLVYKGHPLYYWINDQARGDTNGHGVKNVWFVANITGQLPQTGG